MNQMNQTTAADARHARWLKQYYFARAAFSAAWMLSAFAAGAQTTAAALLLLAYPLWDALANLLDARRSGGLAANRPQALNVIASLGATVAVTVPLGQALPDMHRVLALFGAWAIVSGVLQLATGVRRWKTAGAQWAMVLSGAQSALAGGYFIAQSSLAAEPSVATLAGYAGFGALYFLLSGLALQVKTRRR